MREVDYCERWVKQNDVLATVDEQEIFDERAKLLQKHPKIRGKRHKEELKKCTQQGRGLQHERLGKAAYALEEDDEMAEQKVLGAREKSQK